MFETVLLLAMGLQDVGAMAKPTLELEPPQVVVAPGQPFRIKAKTNAAKVFFDTSGISTLPDEWPLSDRKTCFYGIAPTANGSHEIVCTVFVGEERRIVKVPVFVGNNPLPPAPGPAPGPTPDVALAAELQALYNADKGNPRHRDKLCEVWRQGAEVVLGNAKHKTMSEFTAKMSAVAADWPDEMTPADLQGIRKRLAVALTEACGPGVTELGPPNSDCRKRAADTLNKFALALSGVK